MLHAPKKQKRDKLLFHFSFWLVLLACCKIAGRTLISYGWHVYTYMYVGVCVCGKFRPQHCRSWNRSDSPVRARSILWHLATKQRLLLFLLLLHFANILWLFLSYGRHQITHAIFPLWQMPYMLLALENVLYVLLPQIHIVERHVLVIYMFSLWTLHLRCIHLTVCETFGRVFGLDIHLHLPALALGISSTVFSYVPI